MWRDKCKLIYRAGSNWCATLRNDETIIAPSYLQLQKKVNVTRCDVEADGDEHWVTINNTHVLLNGENTVISGAGGKLNGMSYRSGTNTETFKQYHTSAQIDAHIDYRNVFGTGEKSIMEPAHIAKVCQLLNKHKGKDIPEITPEHAESMIRAIGFAGTKDYVDADDNYTGPVAIIDKGKDTERKVQAITNDKGEAITDLDGNPVPKVNRNASGKYLIRASQRKTLKEAKVAGGDQDLWEMGKEQARHLEDLITVAPKFSEPVQVVSMMGADELAKLEKGGIFNHNGITTGTSNGDEANKAVAEIRNRKKQGDPSTKGVIPVVFKMDKCERAVSIGSILKGGDKSSVMVSGLSNFQVVDMAWDDDLGAMIVSAREMHSDRLNQESAKVSQRFQGDPTRSGGTKYKETEGEKTYKSGKNVNLLKDTHSWDSSKRNVYYDPAKASLSKEQLEARAVARKARAEELRKKNAKLNGEEENS